MHSKHYLSKVLLGAFLIALLCLGVAYIALPRIFLSRLADDFGGHNPVVRAAEARLTQAGVEVILRGVQLEEFFAPECIVIYPWPALFTNEFHYNVSFTCDTVQFDGSALTERTDVSAAAAFKSEIVSMVTALHTAFKAGAFAQLDGTIKTFEIKTHLKRFTVEGHLNYKADRKGYSELFIRLDRGTSYAGFRSWADGWGARYGLDFTSRFKLEGEQYGALFLCDDSSGRVEDALSEYQISDLGFDVSGYLRWAEPNETELKAAMFANVDPFSLTNDRANLELGPSSLGLAFSATHPVRVYGIFPIVHFQFGGDLASEGKADLRLDRDGLRGTIDLGREVMRLQATQLESSSINSGEDVFLSLLQRLSVLLDAL